MNEGDPKAGSGLPASVLGKSPEQIESLLRFLIFLVLHKEKMTPEEYEKSAKEDSSRTERTKKSLLELLRQALPALSVVLVLPSARSIVSQLEQVAGLEHEGVGVTTSEAWS